MTLDFNKFVETKKAEAAQTESPAKAKVKELVTEAQRFLIFNREKIDVCVEITKSLTAFAIHKTPMTLVEGAFNVVKTYVFDKSFYATDFFCETNGWKLFAHDGMSFEGIFSSVIKRFPSQSLRFEYDSNTSAKLVDLSFCKLGVVSNSSSEQIFFQFKEMEVEKILDFLVGEKLKELKTNIISVDFSERNGSAGIALIPEVIFPIASLKADAYTQYIKKCLDLGFNRSIIFNGPPGTGKTTLSQTIIQNLGFRTLKFRYTGSYSYNLFAFIVRKFKIEAVIIDDFDQMDSRDELLEFLEMLKKETKLVIALVNSLSEFHPALLRPGRFDEIMKVDALDVPVVKEIIGPKLSRKYLTKVKSWPIAYINEFVIRSKLLDAVELEAAYKELDVRVKKAIDR